MKKHIILIIIILISTVSAFAQQAVITEMTGTVEVKNADASVWTAARTGMEIDKNTALSTGFRSSVVIKIGKSVITVKSLTCLSIEEIVSLQENERIIFTMQTGRIRTQVNPPTGIKTDFTVRSPSVNASVRGTEFEFDTINLAVIDGEIWYESPPGSTAAVRYGETSRVNELNYVVSSPRDEAAERLVPRLPIGTELEETGGGLITRDGFTISAGWGD